MADAKKTGLAIINAFGKANKEAEAILAAQKAAKEAEALTRAERMAALAETERALPLRLARATPKTKQELASHAERVGRQMLGEHITSGKKGDTKNLAGRSMKENERIKGIEYELEPTKDLPPSTPYEARIGDVNVAFPGDYTVSDVNLKSLQGEMIGSKQEGGSRYGQGKLDMEDPLFWASNEGPAQLAQDKITDVAHIFEPERVLAHHLAMGPVATNFAQHFADANLRAIDYSKLSKKDMDTFDRIIAGGYDVKNQKTGKIESVTFPHWPGIADPEAAYEVMKRDPELRKWFNSRMKTPKVTEATNMPNGLDIQWAITHPELRNMEVNLTGHSVGQMIPGAQLTGTADHQTYSKGIRGKYIGHQNELTPFVISFPDAAQHIASTKRPQDFTGTIQKVFPHQVVDQQYIDELGEYDRQLRKMILGKKKGGAVEKVKVARDPEYDALFKDAMAAEINAARGGEIRSLQWKASGGPLKAQPKTKRMAWKKTPPLKMAQGGAPNLGPSSEHTIPDPMDSGLERFEPGYGYARGGRIQRFDGGGAAVDQSEIAGSEKAKLMAEILARMAKDQGKQEVSSLKKPRAATDLLNRGVVASAAGLPVDLMNMGLTGIDAIRDLASGKPVEKRLASEKPFLGSEHLKDLMDRYGMTSGEDRPMMETALSLFSPAGAIKGAAKTAEAAPKAARAIEGGLNAATAAVRRDFTPATVTMEAVAPDLAKFKPRNWQETATRRMTGPGAPVSMETMNAAKTTKRPGQGVYENFAGQLETNPLVAVDVPFAGNLSTNRALRREISQAGTDLAQESVAAHRFVPMMTNNIADASAMLIKPKGGKLSNEEVIRIGEQLPGMIVAHNPRLGGVVVMPYDYSKGKVPTEFFDAQDIAKTVLGKRAEFTYGKADPVKDRLYIERGDYATEGAGAPSASATAMRDRLKRAEGRAFREPARATAESR